MTAVEIRSPHPVRTSEMCEAVPARSFYVFMAKHLCVARESNASSIDLKVHVFCGNRRFIAIFTRALHCPYFEPSEPIPHLPVILLIALIRATCQGHRILLDLILLVIFGKECNLRSCILCSFLHPPVTSLWTHIFQ